MDSSIESLVDSSLGDMIESLVDSSLDIRRDLETLSFEDFMTGGMTWRLFDSLSFADFSTCGVT